MATGPGGPAEEWSDIVGATTGRVRAGDEYHIASEREKIRGRLAQLVVIALVVYPVLAFALLIAGRITIQDLPAVASVTARSRALQAQRLASTLAATRADVS